jgi:hypothetical protein
MVIDLDLYSRNILYKYMWEYRNDKSRDNLIPENIKKSLNEQLKKNVPEFKGFIPYFTLNNLRGIYKRICTEDEDGVVFVVAPPGFGKSTQTLIYAKFLDPSIDEVRIIFDLNELKHFLGRCAKELKVEKDRAVSGDTYNEKRSMKRKAIILDEGVYMLFSGDAMTKEGKIIQKLFSIIRALNLLILVNATNFRKVNKGVKEERIIGLIRIRRKGRLEFYSKKRIRKIRILENNIFWGRPGYQEETGYIDKTSMYWKMYEQKKTEFLTNAVNDTD